MSAVEQIECCRRAKVGLAEDMPADALAAFVIAEVPAEYAHLDELLVDNPSAPSNPYDPIDPAYTEPDVRDVV